MRSLYPPTGRSSGLLAAALALPALLLVAGPRGADLHAQAPGARAAVEAAHYQGMTYRMVGPARGGRATAVAGHRAHPHTFYMGSTGGGVWKTDDYGASWHNVSDGYFESASIGVIRVAESDPNVIYVGTGSDGIRSNVIIGKGVYRSDDAGKSWRHVGLREAGQIGRMAVHPTNPDVAFVGAIGNPFGNNTERGVFRTRDGGRNWERVLFVSDSIGAYAVVMEPGNPEVLYASLWRGQRKPWTIISGAHSRSGVGIYKSVDGGTTWRKLTNGLPQGLVGKIDVAISPANPRRVYAAVEAPDAERGVYRSDDGGETWRMTSNRRGLMNRPFYYTNIHVDPTNADVVYVNNESFFKSTDGGVNWEIRPTPHGDNHDMWINPDNPDIIVQSNDGGTNVTLNGGRTWSTQLNQPTAELYQVDVDDRFPYWLSAGQQDNSTIRVPSLPWRSAQPDEPQAWWEHLSGCETGPAVPKPGDANIVYGNCKGRFSVYNARTGQEQHYYVGAMNMYGHATSDLAIRFQRVAPIEISPHDPEVIYHASQFVHRTRDGGKTWETISPDLTARPAGTQVVSGEPITRDITGEEFYSTVYAVRESLQEPGVLWVGANDGPFHITRDGGATWQNITPRGLAPGGRVQFVDPSPHRAGKAYYAYYRYLLDDWQPYAYRTTDYGRTWTRLTTGRNGIPNDCPVRVVREDPGHEGLLYAGTECGMFVSFDDGAAWQTLQLNLPVTPISDIKVHRGDLVVATMGRSFWILDNLTPLHQLAAGAAPARAHLYAPREAHRMRYSFRTSSNADPEYLPVGAMIDYHLPASAAGPVTLDVLDATGRVIRSFSSEGPGEATVPTQGMRAPELERVGTPRLPNAAGLNRFMWDLQHAGPWSDNAQRSGRGGPYVVPGEYRVRLTAGDYTETRPLRVLIDPRLPGEGVSQADLEAQLALSMQVRDAITEANLAVAEARTLRQRLAGAYTSSAAGRRFEAAYNELVTAENVNGYPQPMLVDQLGYLYASLSYADQRPGRDQYERFEELRGRVGQLLAELRQSGATLAAMQDR
jgi:photosystem II stability/assembly factor-like uncharacterized protein